MYFTDLHLRDGTFVFWSAAVEQINALREVDAVLVSGDLVHSSPWPWQLSMAKRSLHGLAATIWPTWSQMTLEEQSQRLIITPGNHDLRILGNIPIPWGRRNYGRYFELPPFVRQIRGAQGIVCDVFVIDSNLAWHRLLGLAAGEVQQAQLKMLVDAHLKTTSRPQTCGVDSATVRIALLHHHLLPVVSEHASPTTKERFLAMRNASTVAKVFARLGIDLVLHGHQHARFLARFNPVLGLGGNSEMIVLGGGSVSMGSKVEGRHDGWCFHVVEISDSGSIAVQRYDLEAHNRARPATSNVVVRSPDRARKTWHARRKNVEPQEGVSAKKIMVNVEVNEIGDADVGVHFAGVHVAGGDPTVAFHSFPCADLRLPVGHPSYKPYVVDPDFGGTYLSLPVSDASGRQGFRHVTLQDFVAGNSTRKVLWVQTNRPIGEEPQSRRFTFRMGVANAFGRYFHETQFMDVPQDYGAGADSFLFMSPLPAEELIVNVRFPKNWHVRSCIMVVGKRPESQDELTTSWLDRTRFAQDVFFDPETAIATIHVSHPIVGYTYGLQWTLNEFPGGWHGASDRSKRIWTGLGQMMSSRGEEGSQWLAQVVMDGLRLFKNWLEENGPVPNLVEPLNQLLDRLMNPLTTQDRDTEVTLWIPVPEVETGSVDSGFCLRRSCSIHLRHLRWNVTFRYGQGLVGRAYRHSKIAGFRQSDLAGAPEASPPSHVAGPYLHDGSGLPSHHAVLCFPLTIHRSGDGIQPVANNGLPIGVLSLGEEIEGGFVDALLALEAHRMSVLLSISRSFHHAFESAFKELYLWYTHPGTETLGEL